MDLDELRERLRSLMEQRGTKVASLEAILSGVRARGASDMSTDEASQFEELRKAVTTLDEQRASVQQRIEDIESVRRFQDEQDEFAQRTNPVGSRKAALRVNEADIYRKSGEHSFFADARNMLRSPSAAERIQRHMTHVIRTSGHPESRASNASGDFNSLVPPQYLLDEFAPIAREGRPFLNSVAKGQLPDEGMTVTIPRGVTGTLVGSQTTQNTAVSSRTYTTNDLVVPVITVGGYNDLSRQSVDRARGADEIIMADLTEMYADESDRQAIVGPGTNNQHFGVLSTTSVPVITVSSAGAITQLRQVISSLGTLRTNRRRGAQAIFMHPRRWAFFQQAVDGNGRPLITPEANGPFNSFGRIDQGQDFESSIAGYIQNLPVILDANIPITLSYDVTQSSSTDPIIVTRPTDLRLWEESAVPNMIEVQPDAKNLTVSLVAWGYQAFSAGRYPSATVVLAGSGLTTPPSVG